MKKFWVAGLLCFTLTGLLPASDMPDSVESVDSTDRRIADLKKAFEEITEAFRQRAIDLEKTRAAEREAATAERDVVIAQREAAMLERDQALAARGTAIRERDQALAARDVAALERDQALAERESAIQERDKVAGERESAITERKMQQQRAEGLDAERAQLLEKIADLDSRRSDLQTLQEGTLAVVKAKDDEIARLQETLQDAKQSNAKERFALAYNLGSIYKAAGQFDRAEAQFVKALEMNPSDPALHYNLGILYDDNLKDPVKARHHYERFLALAPNDPDAPNVIKWMKELGSK